MLFLVTLLWLMCNVVVKMIVMILVWLSFVHRLTAVMKQCTLVLAKRY